MRNKIWFIIAAVFYTLMMLGLFQIETYESKGCQTRINWASCWFPEGETPPHSLWDWSKTPSTQTSGKRSYFPFVFSAFIISFTTAIAILPNETKNKVQE